MHILTSIVNEDERLEEIRLDADRPEMPSSTATPMLATPVALTSVVVATKAAGMW